MVVKNKRAAKAVGITMLVFCLVLVVYIVFTSFSVDNQQPNKVYTDLSEIEQNIVDENINRLKEIQHINAAKTEVAKSETDTIDVEPKQANLPVEKQGKVLQEGDLMYGKPVSKEAAGKRTILTNPEIRGDIHDIGNGPIIDHSKERNLTSEELGTLLINSTNIEDLHKHIAELESRNDPAVQPIIDVMKHAVNAKPLSVTTED